MKTKPGRRKRRSAWIRTRARLVKERTDLLRKGGQLMDSGHVLFGVAAFAIADIVDKEHWDISPARHRREALGRKPMTWEDIEARR